MTDPRDIRPAGERDVRPLVERSRAGLSAAAIGGIAAVAGLVLFATLDARRRDTTAPATTAAVADAGSAAPPPLYLPPPPSMPLPIVVPARDVDRLVAPPQARVISPPPVTPVVNPPSPPYVSSPQPSAPPRGGGGAALVVDTSTVEAVANPPGDAPRSAEGGPGRGGVSTGRVRAAMLANRTTTVPQGTLIPAVLETAFDSTSPGFARALIQRDIRGFDGSRVLIPRGSRLIGEYGADVAQGQKRAVILWSRLIRPDGVTIAIGSPAADTLGRGGVQADVNGHFLERFSGAILQSVLDFGVALAARNSRSPVIVALPGSTGAATAAARPRTSDIPPTLTVPAGRSVSVFVARDLDFTGADTVP